MTGENDPGTGKSATGQTLRKRAEEKVVAGNKAFTDMSASEISTLIHELRIHQVELERQNEELRKSQAGTERSRKTYQDLWELSPIGYLIVDVSGRVSAVNRAGQRLFGRPKHALLNECFSTLVAPENRVPVHLMFERALETVSVEKQEIRLLKPNGAIHICLLEIHSLGGKAGRERFQAILMDITNQKRAEEELCNAKDELELWVERRTAELAEVNRKLRQQIEERKRSVGELRESEEKYRQLFENESDAVMIFDAETLRFEDANRATLDLYGYPKEEFLALTVEDVSAEKEKTRVAEKKLKSGEIDDEFVPLRYFKRKDGSVFPGEINAGNFISKGRKKIIGAVRDITERVKTQEVLRKSEERYRALSEATFEAIFISENGVCLDANQRATELFGYDYNELIGIFGTDVIAAEYKELVKGHMLSGYEIPYEVIAQKKDGTKFYVEISGKMMRYEDKDVRITVIRDIDEQKRTAEALHKSEKRYRELFNSVPIGLYRTTPEGSILDVNPAMLDILGYPDQDTLLQSNSLEIYIDPDDRKQLQRLLEEKGFVHDFTVQLCRHDGRSVWVSINSSIVRDSDTQMTCYEGAMADITERIASEERIHQLSQQLIQAQEDERQMISRELHDTVAQDLSVAKMACDLIYAELLGKRQPEAERIQKICEVLQKTILGLRNMAYELRPPLLEELGLVEAIYRFCEDFTQMWGMPVDFQSAGLKNLKLDYTIQINVYRLVQEGLTNIRKHAAAERATLKLTAAFPNIILRVEDNGRGFDVYARAAAAVQEKRMGLRSMQERVTLLNGKMKLQSKPGQGTKVFIKLPFAEKKSGAQENHLNR